MKKVLGKKQRISNEDWIKCMENIEEYVSKEELDARIDQTVEAIKEKTKDLNVAYAWSGGKDSLVLQGVCEKAGIKLCVMVVSNLEYPAFTEWVEENKPELLETINTGQDLEWLSKHQDMLFPQDSSIAAKWFHIVQHRGQDKFFKQHDLDMIILGRRRADGNYVGKASNCYTNKKGTTRYSPLADWSHEEILAYIHYYNVPMPPIYDWKNGYYCGTHEWAARQWTESVENGWKEVYDIDSKIVEQASAFIPSAKEFIEKIQS